MPLSKSSLFLTSFTNLFWISGLLRLVQSEFATIFVFFLFDIVFNLKYSVSIRWSDTTLSKEQKSLSFLLLFFDFNISLCNKAELYFRLVTCISIVELFFSDNVC